jgi:hypothetical protein
MLEPRNCSCRRLYDATARRHYCRSLHVMSNTTRPTTLTNTRNVYCSQSSRRCSSSPCTFTYDEIKPSAHGYVHVTTPETATAWSVATAPDIISAGVARSTGHTIAYANGMSYNQLYKQPSCRVRCMKSVVE